MIKIFSSFLLLNFLLASCNSAWKEPANLVSPIMISREKFDWLVAADTIKLKTVLAKDLRYFHSNGWEQSYKDVLGDAASGKLRYLDIMVKEDSLQVFENTAIVTGTGFFKGLVGEDTFALNMLYMEVYSKQDDQSWQLRQRMATKIKDIE